MDTNRERKRLDWRIIQALLGMLVTSANVVADARSRKTIDPDGAQIVEMDGRRWRVWTDADGNRQATPIDGEVR